MRFKALMLFVLLVFASGCIQLSGGDTSNISQRVIDALQQAKIDYETKTGSAEILIMNSSFHPAELKIKVGAYVGWNNYDSWKHRVLADDKSFWTAELGPFKGTPDGTTMKFKTPGIFVYHCTIHPEMEGKIVVVEDIPIACGDNFCDIQEFKNQSCASDCSLPQR